MIEGEIISYSSDRYGEITIADHNGQRSLYFGNAVMQSCILTEQPWVLQMDYSQAMMSALIFRRRPRSVLLIGLGGGSLVNFLLRACPECSIDVVEISGKVIDLAHDYFYLPKRSENLTIYNAPGQDFVKDGSGADLRYDLILVDAFDEAGPASFLRAADFLTDCRRRLAKGGIFVVNLWNRLGDNFPALYETVDKAFRGGTLKLLLGEVHRNAVVLAFDDPSMPRDLPSYRSEARRLRKELAINFPKFLNYLYWQNFSAASADK